MKTREAMQKDFKKFLIDNDIKQVQLAQILGVTRGAINQKINNFSWNYVDLVNLLDELGYDVVWVKRDENSQAKQ